jgi:perosamine synthetase
VKIPITKAVFDEKEFQAVQEPLKSGWVVQGPFVKRFEGAFAAYTGAKTAVACSSATTALHISLAALGVGHGDEVIVPGFTWVATANAVEYQHAKPVFCDIDLQTFNIHVDDIRRKISKKTKAIIPVHLFGLAANLDEITELARQHNLAVVEDAACAFGTYYRGKHVGTFGDFGCFSFHPRKAITTGEGGMIIPRDDTKDTLCRSLRDHGASKADLVRHTNKGAFLLSEFNMLGYNYRMTDIQGAIGCAQLEKADWIQQQRTARANRYDILLKKFDWLEKPFVPEHCVHGYQSYVCLFRPEPPTLGNVAAMHEQRNTIMLRLEDEGVSTRQGTHAVTTRGYYQQKYGIRDDDFPNTLLADRLSIALPLYAQMTDEEQDYVVDHLAKSYSSIHPR